MHFLACTTTNSTIDDSRGQRTPDYSWWWRTTTDDRGRWRTMTDDDRQPPTSTNADNDRRQLTTIDYNNQWRHRTTDSDQWGPMTTHDKDNDDPWQQRGRVLTCFSTTTTTNCPRPGSWAWLSALCYCTNTKYPRNFLQVCSAHVRVFPQYSLPRRNYFYNSLLSSLEALIDTLRLAADNPEDWLLCSDVWREVRNRSRPPGLTIKAADFLGGLNPFTVPLCVSLSLALRLSDSLALTPTCMRNEYSNNRKGVRSRPTKTLLESASTDFPGRWAAWWTFWGGGWGSEEAS